MATFYCIPGNDPTDESVDLLRAACQQRGLTFTVLHPASYSFVSGPKPTAGDLLYRVGTSENFRALEQFVLGPGVATFYQSYKNFPVALPDSYALYERAGVPIPTTLDVLFFDRPTLLAYAKAVGGFPLILKVKGGSHGRGVIRVDTPEGLYSVCDYLLSSKANVIMRQLIDARAHARLVVVGDKVVDSIEYKAVEGDFRTNAATSPNVTARRYDADVEKTATNAVHARGLEFGGVDIIFDADGKHYMLEVNSPAYFPRAQLLTGVDTAGAMVDHLLAKAASARR